MAEHQLVLVKDAQFLNSLGGKGKSAAETEANSLKVLENYLKNPVKSTYLVFSLNSSLARNTKIYKLLEQYVYFNFFPLKKRIFTVTSMVFIMHIFLNHS